MRVHSLEGGWLVHRLSSLNLWKNLVITKLLINTYYHNSLFLSFNLGDIRNWFAEFILIPVLFTSSTFKMADIIVLKHKLFISENNVLEGREETLFIALLRVVVLSYVTHEILHYFLNFQKFLIKTGHRGEWVAFSSK